MAEIKIEKKKPIWPWIFAGLIILLIIYFIAFTGDKEKASTEEAETEQAEEILQPETTEKIYPNTDTIQNQRLESIDRYLSHIDDKSKMGIQHEYTNNTLIYLLEAVKSKAEQMNVDIDANMQLVQKQAEQITKDPTATNHANKIKQAGTEILKALEKICNQRYPELTPDLNEASKSLENIDPSVLTLNQKEEVNSFFKETGDVLRKMNSQ